jgi:putative ABC transport system permease protein
MISSDVVRTSSTAGVPVTQQGIDKSTLNDIRSSAGQNDVIPIHRTNTQFTLGSTDGRGSVYGFDPTDIPKFLTLQDGSELKGGSDALVGSSIASNFNMNIGSRIKIGPSTQANRPTVRVVGILASRGFASDGINTDNAIIVPDTWYTDTFGGKDVYDQVNVIMGDITKINDTEAAINDKVNRRTQTVRITDASSRLSTITSTLGTITTFIMAIGSISLVVAAVSIFNVMMMSVNERIQEIGILLSIGTEKGEVRRMFLYEALILGIIGACVGGVSSLVIGYSVVGAMIGNTSYFFLPASLIYVPYGMIIGVVICVGSGLYPAWKASNLDPIDALRAE